VTAPVLTLCKCYQIARPLTVFQVGAAIMKTRQNFPRYLKESGI
jgi:hypothetical protein